MNLNQVTVAVEDIKASILFYKKLGLELIVENDHYARFVVPGNEATFSILKTEKYLPNETVIYFETSDVDQKIKDLNAEGLQSEDEPVMQSWLWYEVHLHDPSGNKICIYHAGENRLNPPWRLKN